MRQFLGILRRKEAGVGSEERKEEKTGGEDIIEEEKSAVSDGYVV